MLVIDNRLAEITRLSFVPVLLCFSVFHSFIKHFLKVNQVPGIKLGLGKEQ